MGKKSKKKRSPTTCGKENPTAVAPRSAAISSGAAVEFKKGDRIILRGLESIQYNGRSGSIVSLPKSPGERYGVLVDGKYAPIAVRARNVFSESSRMSTQEQQEQRDKMKSMTELPEEEIMNADQMGMMRLMMNMFMTEEHQVKLYGRKIDPMPNFHMEMMNEPGNIPFAVDRAWAKKYLHFAYEQACSLPHVFEMHFKTKEYKPARSDLMKRLGTNDPRQLEWYFGGQVPGCVYEKRVSGTYPTFFRHSFSNQPYRKEALHLGTTHVAAGFVDLGLLFATELHDPPANRSGPLHFVGVELSSYAVAKTHVIWEMMKQTPPDVTLREDHLRSIMQVWFSATWGQGTERAVKNALDALISSDRTYHPSVSEIFRHWADAPTLALSQAREEVAKATTNARSAIGHLLKKHDRIAVAQYELARDFGVDSKPVCGNTLMFDCPDGTPPLEMDENVFSAFNWNSIIDLMKSSRSKMTVVEAAETYALANISKVALWATSQKVTVELFCAGVQDMIKEIALRKPWTMSWSNLCDYCDYTEFHRMARSCSPHGDTIHFGYSMNWVLIVYGVNIIDFSGRQFAELRASLLESGNKSAKECYQLLGWDQYLRLPPPTNPINTSSHFGLEPLHYKKWASYFFEVARRRGPCEVANIELAFTTSPLSATGQSTVAFTWTYDPDIKFNNLEL